MNVSPLAERLRNAQHVIAFTGAGASAESGIATFRDALKELWERFDPAQLARGAVSCLVNTTSGKGYRTGAAGACLSGSAVPNNARRISSSVKSAFIKPLDVAEVTLMNSSRVP